MESETQQYLNTLMSPLTTPAVINGRKKLSNGGLNEGKEGTEDEEEDEEDEEKDDEERDRSTEIFSSRRSSQSAVDVFFDCSDQISHGSPQQRATLIRWSSELLVGGEQPAEELAEDNSPPRTPNISPTRHLLILIFHGDLFPKVGSFICKFIFSTKKRFPPMPK